MAMAPSVRCDPVSGKNSATAFGKRAEGLFCFISRRFSHVIRSLNKTRHSESIFLPSLQAPAAIAGWRVQTTVFARNVVQSA
jgi:hypothetical protein